MHHISKHTFDTIYLLFAVDKIKIKHNLKSLFINHITGSTLVVFLLLYNGQSEFTSETKRNTYETIVE